MASMKIVAVALAILGIAVSNTLATDYVVGDASGWTLGFDYQAWANGKTFRAGDKIVFKYPAGAHNVVIVDQNSFQACVVPPGAAILETGNDEVTLTPGTNLYICGVGGHCATGQKLSINAAA